jgi:capsid protein
MGKDVFTPQAAKAMSNFGGMAIEVDRTGEAVRYQWYDFKPSMRWIRIRQTRKGRDYFNARNSRWYLDEFMLLRW